MKLSDDVQVVVTIGYIAALEREAESEGRHSVWLAGLRGHQAHDTIAWKDCQRTDCRIVREFIEAAKEASE